MNSNPFIIWEKAKRQYRRMNIVARAGIWFTICNLFLKGIHFITVPIFTRLLPSEEYGQASVFLSYQQILLTLATWETSLSAYQKGLFKYKENKVFFTNVTLLFCNLITLIFFCGAFIFQEPFSSFTGIPWGITWLLFFYMLLEPAYSCWMVEQKTAYRYQKVVCFTMFYSILNAFVPIIMIWLLGRTAEVYFSAILCSSSLFFLLFYVKHSGYYKVWQQKRTAASQMKYLAVYQFPIVIHALSYTVLAQADRVMIGRYVGYAQAAYYSIAYNLGMAISIFQNSVNQALVPWRFEKLDNHQYKAVREVTNYLLAGISILIFAFISIAPEVMKFLFSEEYYEAIWSIPPIVLSVYFMFLYTLFVWIENYYEKTAYVGIISVVCAVVNVILNAACIPVFGYIVCGYTTVASYVLLSIGHYYFMRKTCKEKEVFEEIYDVKMVILISGMMLFGAISIAFLYRYHFMIRYGILIALCIIGILNRRKIIQIIEKCN